MQDRYWQCPLHDASCIGSGASAEADGQFFRANCCTSSIASAISSSLMPFFFKCPDKPSHASAANPKLEALPFAISLNSAELKAVAQAFVKLQNEQHRADDDTSSSGNFTRSEVIGVINEAEIGVEALSNVDDARVFFACWR